MRALGPLIENVRRLPPIAVDGAIGAGIFALGAVGALTTPASGGNTFYVLPHSQRLAAWGLLALASLGAAIRRTNLLVACGLVLLAAFGGLFFWNDQFGSLLPEWALLYTISERGGLGTSLLALITSALLPFVSGYHRAGDTIFFTQVAEGYWPQVVLVWFAGRAQARRLSILSQLEHGVAQLHEERERLSHTAVAAERSRIARDLHALVVRGVGRMGAMTRTSRELLRSEPEGFSEMVGAIESIGRATLVEMRRLLLILRTRAVAAGQPRGVVWSDGHPDRSVSGKWNGSRATAPIAPGSNRTRSLADAMRRWIGIPWVGDVLLVLVLAILAVTEPLLAPWSFWPFVPLSAIAVAVLLVRRPFPRVVLLVVAVDVFVWNAFLGGDSLTTDRSLLVAVFTVAAIRGLWWGLVALGAEVAAYLPLMYVRPQILWPYDVVGLSATFLFAFFGGLAVHNATRLNTELRDQTELLRRTREERVRLAVDEERIRIARDAHDLVAHGVTVMVLHAGAARWLAQTDPRQADQALDAIKRAGEEALRDLHSLVGSLGSMPAPSQPLPSDEQLTIRSLLDREVDAGMHVELVIAGAPRELDAGLELALYRIVQEALTNVRKHVPGARAWVELRYTPEGVEVEVTDSGGGAAGGTPTVPGAGLGLVGITERAGLFGGRAEAGPTPEGGFRVRATLHEGRVLV